MSLTFYSWQLSLESQKSSFLRKSSFVWAANEFSTYYQLQSIPRNPDLYLVQALQSSFGNFPSKNPACPTCLPSLKSHFGGFIHSIIISSCCPLNLDKFSHHHAQFQTLVIIMHSSRHWWPKERWKNSKIPPHGRRGCLPCKRALF